MIPYGRQDISQADIEAVQAVLASDWLTQGPNVPRFEEAVASRCRVEHAVAVNSATSALHISCLALGVQAGDRIWTSPNTFVASANCGLYIGATVDFVDIDPHTYCMSVGALKAKLETSQAAGTLPKVVIPVHFAGASCEMKEIKQLSKKYGFRIIEDASHAIGGAYRDVPVGSCEYSDITVFSFHPVKMITTGEGGMALTNDPSLNARMTLLRSHGIVRDSSLMDQSPDGDWYYQQIELGYNYRITDLQAALGASQLERLDQFVSYRSDIAQRYDRAFQGLEIATQQIPDYTRSSRHLYVVRLSADRLRARRKEIFDAMRAAGIGVNVHYIPVHTQPHYRKLGFKPGDFPEAERYYSEAISLPIHCRLSASDQEFVIRTLGELIG